ncbi:hypothetical protein [Endozoicomonas atrinae]|uniref:hypothetical protein n=1 Tax=Endozoicomonas atrinae TaxID=1333660 RepID=UPI003B00EF38
MVAGRKIPPEMNPPPLNTTNPPLHNSNQQNKVKRVKGKRVSHFVSFKGFVAGIKRIFSFVILLKNIRSRRINHLQQVIALPSTARSRAVDQCIGNMVLAVIRGDFNDIEQQKNLFRKQINQDAIQQGKGSRAGPDDTRLLFIAWAESIKTTPLGKQIRKLLKSHHARLHRNAMAFISLYGGVHDFTPYQADIVSSYNLLMRCLIDVLMPSDKDMQYMMDSVEKEECSPSPHTQVLLKEILAAHPVQPPARKSAAGGG